MTAADKLRALERAVEDFRQVVRQPGQRDALEQGEVQGYTARRFFPNGYGVSILCRTMRTGASYGTADGCFELALLRGTEESFTVFAPEAQFALGFDDWFAVDPIDLSDQVRQVRDLPKPAGPCNLASDDAFDEMGRANQ